MFFDAINDRLEKFNKYFARGFKTACQIFSFVIVVYFLGTMIITGTLVVQLLAVVIVFIVISTYIGYLYYYLKEG